MSPSARGFCRRIWLAASLSLLMAAPALAGVTGKIAGQVIDKKTKEALIGAAVQISDLKMGVLTDVDGKFQIAPVPAGDHTVEVRMVGYTAVITQAVLVRPDQTTTLKVDFVPSLIELQPIIVTRERQMIQMDEATTKRDVTAEKIKSMPVTNVADILKSQVGVTVRNDRFHIRGGRSEEVLYTVDGVSMKDPLGGRGATESLNLSGTEIENISIIKGGWSAEYGEATSGIINVATKEGDRNVTRGHIEYFTDGFGTHNLDRYSFKFNRLEFNIGGPEPLITRKLLPLIGLESFADKVSYFLNLDFDRTNTYASLDKYATNLLPMKTRQTKFLGIKVTDRQSNNGNMLLKLTCRVSPDIRLNAIASRGYERSIPWGWGDYSAWQYRYNTGSLPWVEDINDRFSLTWTHNLSPTTFYQILVSKFHRRYQQKPGDPTTPGGTMNPDQFLFPTPGVGVDITKIADHYQDMNKNGRYDAPEEWVDLYPDNFFNMGDIANDRNRDNRINGDELIYDFNGNGRFDDDSGEPFVDRNGNGTYDGLTVFAGDSTLQFASQSPVLIGDADLITLDGNGNGRYDPERDMSYGATNNDKAESYLDGDISLGEPFSDINRNGVRDGRLPGYPFGEPFTDLSYNSKYDGPNDSWVPGVPFREFNGNGVFDKGGDVSGKWSTNPTYYKLGEPFYDRNGNGQWDAEDGFFDNGWDTDILWSKRDVVTNALDIDLTSQVRREHEVKLGFKFASYRLRQSEITQAYLPYDNLNFADDGPYQGRGNVRDFYTQTPKSGAFYIRDKMEYGQMIANLGFRYDYFIQSSNADITSGGATDEFGNRIVSEQYRDKFAPRIAFSYPISDKAKVFFNYGHFYQLPEMTYMYRRATQSSSSTGVIGNVNLDYAKTIQYEFGIQYMLSPTYVLSVQGFYKDDFGRVNASNQATGSVQTIRNFYENRDYARARGLEVELEKKYGNYVSGTLTYNFAYAYGKASANSLDFFDNFYAKKVTIQEFPLDWDQRHAITMVVDLRVPPKDHPKLFGMTLPDNFGLNIFWQFGSGYPYTPGKLHPGVRVVPGNDPLTNSMRLPATSNVDLRFNKDFRASSLNFTFEIWVNNVFDTRNIASVYADTGVPTTGLNFHGIPYMDVGQSSPRNWEAGRQIRLGLGVNF
ncbi:MAG: TonB-dependent receptor [candidate division Zixibacteria bacterium]|nr:TonB-dependent receptor [candidate division Zixibacteria bacterium]